MPKVRSTKSKRRSFNGNRYTISRSANSKEEDVITASSSKLNTSVDRKRVAVDNCHDLKGNRIFDVSILVSVFSVLCCPACFQTGLQLIEDSKYGICSNFSLVCECGYIKGFSSTSKKDKKCIINSLLVFGLRLIGKGYTAGKKLLFTLNLPFISKSAFRRHESQLLEAVKCASEENMLEASKEIKKLKKSYVCGVSVDGTWQRRGHTSLNGCVSAISIDTGKLLDLEIMSQYCSICKNNEIIDNHMCRNHKGSAASMEVVGAYRIFERSLKKRELQYSDYYGDGDSKAYMEVKDIYGKDSVQKLECIGHVQKRVGTRLRKLKKSKKGLGGKGRLTDKFIDKLQNYYGIAIRSNVGNLLNMQSATIAAFFHCCSNRKKQMHGQCPVGPDSWCKYQRAVHAGLKFDEKSPGLPDSIVKIIKPTYTSLCNQSLLSKCLHGMTQNCNESFNNMLWSLLPKEVFVGLQTMLLGGYITVILFNSGYLGLLHVFENLGIKIEKEIVLNYKLIDIDRIKNSKRHSLPTAKMTRKKRKYIKKIKLTHYESKEGLTYKCGEF